MSANEKWEPFFKDTPIGELLEKGYSDASISKITGMTASAVNKWRQGVNKANQVNQAKAQGYLKALDEITKVPEKMENVLAEHLFMVSVPVSGLERFNKVVTMLGLTAVDMD